MAGTEIILRRGKGASLFPADQVSHDAIMSMDRDRFIAALVKQPRNPRQTRWFHSMLHLIVQNHPDFLDTDDLKQQLKIKARMFSPRINKSGAVEYVLESTSTTDMDHIVFSARMKRMRYIIQNEILDGVTDDQVLAEIARAL